MNPVSHISHDFNHQISSLKSEVLKMAALTRCNLERAAQALFDRNPELARAVIAEDRHINSLECVVDRMGMEILVRYQPVASDLRFVVSSMKISTHLERIADHSAGIAKRAEKIIASPELPDVNLIEPIYTLADHLLRDAISSYSDLNASLGASLHARDKKLDKLHKKAAAQFSSRIEEVQGRSQEYLQLILIIRSLERIGDLACNIGEDSFFLDQARDLRHKSDEERE
jgi:phosphate transport system protein